MRNGGIGNRVRALFSVSISVRTIVQSGLRAICSVRCVGWLLWTKLEARREHLFHKQTSGNCFKRIVDRFGNGLLTCVWLGDQVGKSSSCFADSITSRSPDDLHDFSQATAITNGYGSVRQSVNSDNWRQTEISPIATLSRSRQFVTVVT